MEGADKLGTTTINVRYDSSKLRAIGCTPNSDFKNAICNTQRRSYIVGFSFIIPDFEGISGDIELADIEFEVISKVDRALDLGLDVTVFTDPYGNELPLTIPLANIPPQLPLFLPLIQK